MSQYWYKTGYCFETGGYEEMPVVANTPAIMTTPAPPHANETYVARLTWKQSTRTRSFTMTADRWITAHFQMYFDDNVAPSSDIDFATFEDDSGVCWTLRLEQGPGTSYITLIDANGTEYAYRLASVTADAWHDWEVKFKHDNSTSIEVWVDGVRGFSRSSFDASAGGTTAFFHSYMNSTTDTLFTAHAIILEDNGTLIHEVPTIDRTWYYRCYQNTTQGATGDLGGNAFETGTWADVGELPANDANYGKWTVGGLNPNTKEGGVYSNDGARTGPNGDSAVDASDDLVGVNFVSRARAGTVKKVKFHLYYGSNFTYNSYDYGLINNAWENRMQSLYVLQTGCPAKTGSVCIGGKATEPGPGFLDVGQLWIGEQWGCVCYVEPIPMWHVAIDGLITEPV